MSAFEPKDPDFRARVAASFCTAGGMSSLGVTIDQLEAGEIEPNWPCHTTRPSASNMVSFMRALSRQS